MRNSSVAATIAGVLAGALLLAACGGDSSNGDGTGLELGDVIESTSAGTTGEPWYVWNDEACAFEETDDHPDEYQAELRTVEDDARFGYMYYGASDPYGIAVNESVEATAEEAGMQLDVYNLKFPSRTEPRSAAESALVKQNAGVMQANLDPSVLPGFFDVLEEEGCVPSIQMHIPVDGRPAMGNYFPVVGREIGDYIAAEAQERGWKPQDTAVVQCTDPDNGPTVNVMFEEIPKAMAAADFAVPDENVFDLVCRLTESEAGRKRVTDWFTANPGFDHVAFTSIDSIRIADMINAVETEGLPDEDTIVSDGQADERSREFIREGTEDMAIAGFPERFGEWLVPMMEDIMVGNPVPAFVGTEPLRLTTDNVDKRYPNE
jgi:ribose transport system substrate-binding protein